MPDITCAQAPDGSYNTAYLNGPTVQLGNAALGAFSWGALADGGTLVLYTDGTNDFGDGPTIANIIEEIFDGGTTGEDIDLTATHGAWTQNHHTIPTYNADAHSGSHSALAGDENAISYGIEKDIGSSQTEIYCSRCCKVPDGYYYPGATAEETHPQGSPKDIWLFGEDGSVNDAYLFANTGSLKIISGNDLNPGLNITKSYGVSWQWDDWVQDSVYFKAGATPESDAGVAWWQTVLEGVSQNISSSTPTIFASGTGPTYGWRYIQVWGYNNSSYGPSSNQLMLMDSLYFAWGTNAAARIMIGDSATFTSCKRLMHCYPTSWTSTRIDITLRLGSHASFSGTHLHVIDENNSPNVQLALAA